MKLLILAILLIGCCKQEDAFYKQIVSVGGCDKYGECGVAYSDGTFGESYRPAIGMSVNAGCRK